MMIRALGAVVGGYLSINGVASVYFSTSAVIFIGALATFSSLKPS